MPGCIDASKANCRSRSVRSVFVRRVDNAADPCGRGWPRSIKDFCESSPFRLRPNYLPDVAAMGSIRNRICHSHDRIHAVGRFFLLLLVLLPLLLLRPSARLFHVDDQRRVDRPARMGCSFVRSHSTRRMRVSFPPGEMSRDLISEALSDRG